MSISKWYKITNGNEMIDRVIKNFDKFLIVSVIGKKADDNRTSIMPSDKVVDEIISITKNGNFEEVIFVPRNNNSIICISNKDIFIGSGSKENFEECIKKLSILDLNFINECNEQ